MPGNVGIAASAMDGMYRHQRYIYDLTRRYYLIGRDQLPATLLQKIDKFQYTAWSLFGLHLAMHEPARLTAEAFDPNIHRTLKWSLGAETMDDLIRYDWPGNIRELENVIERAVILSPGSVLRVPLEDLRSQVIPSKGGPRQGTLEEAERCQILATLKETRWVLSGPTGAAIRLGLNRSTLQFRMKKLGIFRPGTESSN